ncbi:MAG: hypothetical protein PHW64_03925 [Sulfuricurvum sp.]|nr:hypothetical protein [Sulfuricurvum sp.]
MKKLLAITLLPLAVYAQGYSDVYDGYSYFSIGMESASYSEDFFSSSLGENVHSSAKASSPVYISGALVRINHRYDFSMDMSSTLLPTQSDEQWSGSTSGLLQTNQFDSTINSMQFLGHYKFTNNHRFVLGSTYKLDSYKRYTFKDANGNYLNQLDSNGNDTGVKLGLSQERVATLYATTGYWYESIPHASLGNIRFKANTLVSLPVWNEASNTAFEKITFNSTSGYKLEANVYAGYPLMKGLEIGLFAGYSEQKKSGTDTAADGRTKWPENTLKVTQAGVSVVWNFTKE